MTDKMLDAACKAFSEGWTVYPDSEARTQVTDWFVLDAQDAVDFGVLKEPKWSGHSDLRGAEHEAYVAAVVREPMRGALRAALEEVAAASDQIADAMINALGVSVVRKSDKAKISAAAAKFVRALSDKG